MFDFIDKFLQPYIDNFRNNPEIYLIFGLLIYLAWVFGRISRRLQMRRLATELGLPFLPYAFRWDLFPSLSFIVKNFNIGCAIDLLEGEVNGNYCVIFDFYFRKRSFLSRCDERLITFGNGKYFKNCSIGELREAVVKNDFSGLYLGDDKSQYLGYREVSVLNTYYNLKLKKQDIEIKSVKTVTNMFRAINYKSLTGRLEDGALMNKLNVDANYALDEIESKLASEKYSISRDETKNILDEYISVLSLRSNNDIINSLNTNKL